MAYGPPMAMLPTMLEQDRTRASSSGWEAAWRRPWTSAGGAAVVSDERVPGSHSNVTAQERAVEIGSASLTGVRGRVAKSVAKPIARRTGLTREQVEAIIGFLILAYGIYQVVRPLVRASRRTT